MKFDILLFDADDTLLDFVSAEQRALETVFHGLCLRDVEKAVSRYHEINEALWRAYERGEIPKGEIFTSRFARLFEEFGVNRDAEAFSVHYLDTLAEGGDLLPGAAETCRELAKSYRLYVVTNGYARTQRRRMEASGLAPYFSGAFVSEETGSQKPMKEFFDYVAARIPGYTPERALLIGDSLTSDMRGGENAGLATCWYNPAHMENTLHVRVDYEIHALSELPPFLAELG